MSFLSVGSSSQIKSRLGPVLRVSLYMPDLTNLLKVPKTPQKTAGSPPEESL